MTLPSPASPRILIVSADEKTTTELREMLRGWGYPVEVATDGVDGGKVLTRPDAPGHCPDRCRAAIAGRN